jgi:short-subunit dehydrogenase
MTTNHAEFHSRYGPWAVVAGASEGLGAAYARQLAARGLNLVLIARRNELLQALSAQLIQDHGVQVQVCALDLSSSAAAQVVDQVTANVDVGLLIYNAAFSAVGPFLDHPLEDHLREVDTNIRTPMVLMDRFGRRLLDRGRGGLILMSSLSAFQGSAFISNYSATKAFNMVLAEGLWEEWRARGVDVLACIAGATNTPNYRASSPSPTGRFSDATLEPEAVVLEALQAIGRQPQIIPGRSNRMSSFIMRHLLPRRAAVQFMGRVLRDMYVDPVRLSRMT